MYQEFKKIPQKDILYTDTDSIIFTNNHINQFTIGKQLGQFKIEHYKENILLYGHKTYLIGDQITVSGIKPKEITKQQFIQGKTTITKMKTMANTQNLNQVGTFFKEERNLHQQEENYLHIQEKLQNQAIYIDNDINDISYFVNHFQPQNI